MSLEVEGLVPVGEGHCLVVSAVLVDSVEGNNDGVRPFCIRQEPYLGTSVHHSS